MIKHTGHQWQALGESEVTTKEGGKLLRKVNQVMWICDNCSVVTLIDTPVGIPSRHPSDMPVIYGTEPKEIDGTIIMEPEIGSCGEEYTMQVVDA